MRRLRRTHFRARYCLAVSIAISLFSAESKAWDMYDVVYSGDATIGNYVYGVDSASGSRTLLTTKLFAGNSYWPDNSNVDGYNRLIIDAQGGASGTVHIYNPATNQWTDVPGRGSGSPIINDLTFGTSPISLEADGTLSIGPNSLKLRERDGREQMWATDADGNPIDIDIINGSDLLINGRSVQGQIDENRSLIDANTTQIKKNIDNINNLAQGVAASTALTSALSSLPTVSEDSPFSCGVGTGGYSSRAAMGLGCAAKLSDRLSFNFGGSYVFGGTYSYGGGSLDTMAARGGFVFKLGKIDDSPKVAAKKAAKLHDLVGKVQEENTLIKTQNQQLQKLLTQQSALLAATQERLDHLEQVAGINVPMSGDRASR